MEQIFLDAIHSKNKVILTFFSKEDGTRLVRKCAPMDFGPSSKAHDKSDRYHFWDYDSDKGPHTLSLPLEQVIDIKLCNEKFEPETFVNWKPNWLFKRDWGAYS